MNATATKREPLEPPDRPLPASRPVYSIGAVARMLGVEPGTLRAWEHRYRLVAPARSHGSHRLYSRAQVEQLRFVVDAMATGASAADAHRLLAEQLAQPTDGGVTSQAGRPLILLADRDRFSAEFGEHVLRTAGYDVSVASDSSAAEQVVAEQRPELSVVELTMPGGVDLCRRLGGDSSSPVIGVSAVALRDEALTAGASVFLQKPLEPQLLVSTVRDLLASDVDARRAAAPVA